MKILVLIAILLVVLVYLKISDVQEGLTDAQNAIQDDINFLIAVRNHTAPNHNANKKLGEITNKDHKNRINNDIVKNYSTGNANVIITLETTVVEAITRLIKRRDKAK
jgi:hypothetical protein